MCSAFRAGLARLMMAVTATTLLVPAAAFAGGAVARAGVDCGMSTYPWYEVSVYSKDVQFTHTVVYATLIPDSSATRTISRTTTLTAGIQIQGGVTAEAGAIIAKASVAVGVTLKGEGSATDGGSMSLTANNNSDKIHDYVFFNGTRTAYGKWTRYYCSGSQVKVSSYGTWKSWDAQYFAVLRCDNDASVASKYGAWSIQYRAVRTCE